MVTRAYLDTIRETARFWEPYDRLANEASLVIYLQAGLPDWDPGSSNLLRRAIPLMVEWNRLQSETAHQQIRRALLPWAEGDDLNVLGVGPPVVLREPGEDDDDYRLRIALARLGLNIGSLPSVEQHAREVMPDLTDVLVLTYPNRLRPEG